MTLIQRQAADLSPGPCLSMVLNQIINFSLLWVIIQNEKSNYSTDFKNVQLLCFNLLLLL